MNRHKSRRKTFIIRRFIWSHTHLKIPRNKNQNFSRLYHRTIWKVVNLITVLNEIIISKQSTRFVGASPNRSLFVSVYIIFPVNISYVFSLFDIAIETLSLFITHLASYRSVTIFLRNFKYHVITTTSNLSPPIWHLGKIIPLLMPLKAFRNRILLQACKTIHL